MLHFTLCNYFRCRRYLKQIMLIVFLSCFIVAVGLAYWLMPTDDNDKPPIVRPFVPAYNQDITDQKINDTLNCDVDRDFAKAVVSAFDKSS